MNHPPRQSGDRLPPRLFVVNQVVGPLMWQLLEAMEHRGVSCEALTGWVDCPPDRAPSFRVRRGAKLRKQPAFKRIWSWGLFTLQALWALVRRRRAPALVVTNPPLTMLTLPLLRRLTGLRYVLLFYDIYPDAMERMGMLKAGSCASRCWRRLSRRAMLRSAGVITIGERMAETLRGHLRPSDDVPIEVIPNWADTSFIRPMPRDENPFARRHGLVGKFVVLYSGAFGATHDVDSIVAAARMLQDLPEVHFVLIGGGTRREQVEKRVREAALANLTLLDFQPLETLPYSLASADCQIVCLDEGYEGISVPSKTYNALAAGSAVLAVSPPDTELTELVARHGVGRHIPPRSPEALADAVRFYYENPAALVEARAAARGLAEHRYSLDAGAEHYARYLSRTLGWR